MTQTTRAMDRLTPEQRKRVTAMAREFAIYAEAKRWNAAHLPKKPPVGRVSWGSLEDMPQGEWELAE